jgi:hypothetical protein
MFKKGPIPSLAHGLLDYVFGALLIASPFLFSFDSNAAKATGIVAGVIVIVLTACTDWTAGLIKSVPASAHAIFDVIVAILLIASPFLFGFSDETNPTAVFLISGVLALLYAIATRYTPEPRPARRDRGQLDRSASESSKRADGSSSESPSSERSRRSR